MDGQLHEFSDTRATSGQFTNHMQQLMGADFEPDPLFLEETWRLGMPAAAENWHRRRQQARPVRRATRFDGGSTRSFLHTAAWAADFFNPPAENATDTPQTWTPQSWTPRDRSAQSWIPHGWKPQGWAPRDDEPPAHEASFATLDNSMAADRACRILGVTPDSSREQIRSAYRRKVSQCHPDRLHSATDAVRKLATEQMAELNDAYRLLCDLLPHRAA